MKPINAKMLLFIFLAVVIGVFLAITTRQRINMPPSLINTLEQVEAGKTTVGQLDNLSNRFGQKEQNGKTMIFVGENRPQGYSTIEVEQGIVKQIIINDRQRFEFFSSAQYQEKYGKPDLSLYGPWQESGYISDIYLRLGLIVIGHQRTNDVVEVWKIPAEITTDRLFAAYGDQFFSSPQPKNQF